MPPKAGQTPHYRKGINRMLAYLIFMGLLAAALLLWGVAIFRFDPPSDEDPLVEDE